MGKPARWDQDSFRGREDNGSETAADWIADVNIDWTQDVDQNFRVRFLVDNYGGESGSVDAQLQYNRNSLGWNDVTTTSSVVKSTLSGYFVDDDTTTQQVGSGTFVSGHMDEASGVTSAVTLAVSEETEFEFCAQIVSGDVADEDTIELRLLESDTTEYDLYTNTPSITANKAAAVTEIASGYGGSRAAVTGFQTAYATAGGQATESGQAAGFGIVTVAVSSRAVGEGRGDGSRTVLATAIGEAIGEGRGQGIRIVPAVAAGRGAGEGRAQGLQIVSTTLYGAVTSEARTQALQIVSTAALGEGISEARVQGSRTILVLVRGTGLGAATVPPLVTAIASARSQASGEGLAGVLVIRFVLARGTAVGASVGDGSVPAAPGAAIAHHTRLGMEQVGTKTSRAVLGVSTIEIE